MDNYYNTAVEKIGGVNYCIYCCKPALEKIIYGHPHNNDPDEYYYWCECDGAKAELEMRERIQAIRNEYGCRVVRNSEGLNEIRYQLELKILNNKYMRR